jgi:hypothetical protein
MEVGQGRNWGCSAKGKKRVVSALHISHYKQVTRCVYVGG